MSSKNPKLEDFTEIETADYGIKQLYWEGNYITDDGSRIPLEMTVTEYAGDKDHYAYFSVDFRQDKQKNFGRDEFETLDEALLDAHFRIEDLYQGEEILDDQYFNCSMLANYGG